MATSIKALLNKKGWTGDEVGKAIIFSLIDAYKQTLDGVEKPTELFSPIQLKTMVNSLTNKEQGKRYNRYVGLNNWVSQNNAIALSYYEQARGEINRLLGIISTAHATEDEYRYAERLPAIMTKKQYDEIRAQRIEEQLADETGHGVFALVLRAVTHFVSLLQHDPQCENPLRPLRASYQREQISSPRLLERYNHVMQKGYYALADGRRSDQMSAKAWQEAVSTIAPPKDPEERQDASYYRDRFYGRSPSGIAVRREVEKANAIFRGGAEESPYTWHAYAEPPIGATKWDILASEKLLDFYCGDGEPTLARIEDFQSEFPALFDAVVSEIDRQFFAGGNGIANLPLRQWETTTFTPRALYDMDFYGFRERIEADESIFQQNKQARMNGIALLRPSDIQSNRAATDERGYYAEPARKNNMSILCGLEQFTPMNKEYIACIETLETAKTTIENGFYFLMGYDKAIELIADYIDIQDFLIFKIGKEPIADRVEAMNGLVAMLYKQIKETAYQDETAKETKLKVLRNYFQPIKLSEFSIPEKAVEQARALLIDNMRAFEVQDNVFLSLLTTKEGA